MTLLKKSFKKPKKLLIDTYVEAVIFDLLIGDIPVGAANKLIKEHRGQGVVANTVMPVLRKWIELGLIHPPRIEQNIRKRLESKEK